MERINVWLLVVTICGLYVCYGAKHENNDTITERMFRKRIFHIHEHNGDITSENATSIIQEESKYFLKKLFLEYGAGDKMELAGLEKLLSRVGYNTEDADHEHGEGEHEHGEREHELGEGEHEHNKTSEHGEHKDAPNPLLHFPRLKKGHLGHDKNNGKGDHEHGDNSEHDAPDIPGEHGHDAASDGNKHANTKNNENGGNNNTDSEQGEHGYKVQGKHDKHDKHDRFDKQENSDHHDEEREKNREEQLKATDNDNKEHEEKREHAIEGQGDISNPDYEGHRDKKDYGHVYSSDHDSLQREDYGQDRRVDKHNDNSDDVRGADSEHGDHSHGKQGKTLAKNRKRNKSRSKGKKSRHHKKKPGRSSGKKKVQRDKRAAPSVIFHTHGVHSDCLSITELLSIFHFDEKDKITQRDFLYISPAIIYQLDNPHCRRRESNASHDHSHGRRTQAGGISGRVWGYSSAAVIVISLVGLLGVAVIPIMQRIFYNQLLHFLVAMAVGALTGDAMLHLLPHAIAGEVSVEEGGGEVHDHSGGVWKGMCGLAGIYFFFILQRLLTIITGVRNKRQRRRKDRMLQKQMSPDGPVGIIKLKDDLKDDMDGNITVFIRAPDSDSKNEQLTPLKPGANAHDAEEYDHVGHSHGGHGHSHHDGPMPTSVSAVAWMIILGDGVHNLSDGLAIGAAFASSITGGLSTAIAVFCHELPHEIGDFAVLLKSGMSVKQAVLYNCLSSVLSFIGMLIGVGLGNIHEASTWIFAAVGGMFIYISLVNMIPELTSVVSPKPLRDLILQCIGMCVGSGIMLAIAVYEKDLLTILG